MPYDARVVKVMIASPGDVQKERQNIRDVLNEWNYIHSEDKKLVLMPIGWETHSSPAMGDRPQAIINKQVLANCDLLVAVFWTRIGTPTGQAVSGTVEEIEEHRSAGKPAMLYFSSAPVRPDSVDGEQYAALKQFKNECRDKALFESYDSVEEFREKFTRQLSQTIIRYYPSVDDHVDAGSSQTSATPTLGEAAKELLLEATTANDGAVMMARYQGGLAVQANGKNFAVPGDPRSEAKWEEAVQELELLGLIQDLDTGVVYRVTNKGYRMADTLRGSS